MVQKCRHIILLCSDHKDQSERLGNTPASTIIDAIEDVYGYPANEIQNLTYQLCHKYTRSIPNTAYYAHLVTSRTRLHDHQARLPLLYSGCGVFPAMCAGHANQGAMMIMMSVEKKVDERQSQLKKYFVVYIYLFMFFTLPAMSY